MLACIHPHHLGTPPPFKVIRLGAKDASYFRRSTDSGPSSTINRAEKRQAPLPFELNRVPPSFPIVLLIASDAVDEIRTVVVDFRMTSGQLEGFQTRIEVADHLVTPTRLLELHWLQITQSSCS